MNRFVVDSNIIWSLAYNAKSEIGQLIMASSHDTLKLYAPEYLKVELEKQLDRIISLSKQPKAQVRLVLDQAYKKLHFISDEQIPFEFYKKAIPLVKDIDMDDIVFVALAEYLDNLLWTGDIKLLNGLRAKGYKKAVDFSDVKKILEESRD